MSTIHRRFRIAFLLLLLAAGAANVGRIVSNTRYVYGAGDLYAYWHAGQFVRQRANPYGSVTGRAPDLTLPITFLDGETYSRLPQPWTGIGIPTLTAPLIWFFSFFSLFSWPVAKFAWMALNLALVLLIPWMLLQLLPGPPGRAWTTYVALLAIFAALAAVRSTGGNGQTSLLIFALMLGALQFQKRYPVLAGILTGVALAKYSLALPLLLVFLFRHRWRIVTVAALVQLGAAGALSLYTGTSLLEIGRAYVLTLLRHAPLGGIHLSYAFPGLAGSLLTGAATVAAWGGVLFWYRKRADARGTAPRLVDLHLLLIWSVWTVLIAYHGRYDTVIILPFYGLLLGQGDLPAGTRWRMSDRQYRFLLAFGLLALIPLFLPLTVSWSQPPRVPEIWRIVNTGAFSLTLLTLMCVSLWLLFRVPRVAGSPTRTLGVPPP